MRACLFVERQAVSEKGGCPARRCQEGIVSSQRRVTQSDPPEIHQSPSLEIGKHADCPTKQRHDSQGAPPLLCDAMHSSAFKRAVNQSVSQSTM